MRKRILIAAYTIVALLLFKFAFTYGYNEWVISKYEEGDYTENFSILEVGNFNEPYIVYYNNGNVMYQNKDYEAAIEYYEQALDENPPEGKECPIRINLALAMLQLLGDDYLLPEKIDDSIEILTDCLDVLSEEDCANEDGDGHDNRAQRLYDEIKEMLDQAQEEKEKQEEEQQQQQQQQQGQDPQDPNQDPNGDPNDPNNQDQQDPNGGNEEDEEQKKAEQEKKEQRQQEIEDEMDKRMDQSNDQRQEERKKSQAQDEDWNWYYDEMPVW